MAGDSTLRTVAVAGAASNLVNNLPAYLAVETAVAPGHTTQLLGALLGTNAGPLILVWGSLATLLLRERCRARGVTISAARFALIGAGGVPLVLTATWTPRPAATPLDRALGRSTERDLFRYRMDKSSGRPR